MLSDMATTGLWGLWFWLCRPALGLLVWVRGAEVQRALAHLLTLTGSSGIARSVIAVGAAGGAVWFCGRLAQRRRPMSAPVSSPDYAAHFGLSDAQLNRYRASQVCVVRHDDEGRVVGIEAVAPAPLTLVAVPEAAAPSSNPPELARPLRRRYSALKLGAALVQAGKVVRINFRARPYSSKPTKTAA